MPAVLVIDGHPNPDSLTAAIARTYAHHSTDARLLAVRDLDFDLQLRFGYTRRMPIEPDLVEARQAIRNAQHLVIATPVWWRSSRRAARRWTCSR
ncbi:NAD(P)H-dependent oxidoreductase [Spiractinospora alimapuensis]|uniref:NAD(P)H-dependent oxidoreductase n=1 Tax=Spiractinospora alimapuensis TaxID=2820884 RepID=UPI00374407BC